MTLAAEIGGVAIALQLLSGLPYRWLIVLAVVALGGRDLGDVVPVDRAGLRVRRALHARLRGRGGEGRPGLGEGRKRFHPARLARTTRLLYAYFVVGLLGAAMTPYEVYFYSSGGVEEQWTPKDIGLNRANAIVGYGLGGMLSIALMIVGAHALPRPRHLAGAPRHDRSRCGATRSASSGLLLALVGILFAVGGASIDTVFSGAYNLAQFCGWEWGRYRHPGRRASFRADVDRSPGSGEWGS